MRRLLVVLALVATACGGVASVANDPSVDEIATSTAATSAGVGQEPATEEPAPAAATSSAATLDTTREKPEGRPAPDFVLGLGEGGEFSPASESRPIYMVFWAEW